MYKPALNKTNQTYGLEYLTGSKEMEINTNLRVSTEQNEWTNGLIIVLHMAHKSCFFGAAVNFKSSDNGVQLFTCPSLSVRFLKKISLSHPLVWEEQCPLYCLYKVVKFSTVALERAAAPFPVSDGKYCSAE